MSCEPDKILAGVPSDERHQELEEAKVEGEPENLPCTAKPGTNSHPYCESITPKGQCNEKGFNKLHGS